MKFHHIIFLNELENLRKYGYSESSEVLVELSTEEIIQGIKEMKKEIWCDNLTRSKDGGYLIATTTYGSELAPQVQQLRELRDNILLKTESGASFMDNFNQVYYSFSPIMADYERKNPAFREMVKVAITPMISSLSLLNHVEMSSDQEVLGHGISLILLNIGMYVGITGIVIVGIRRI